MGSVQSTFFVSLSTEPGLYTVYKQDVFLFFFCTYTEQIASEPWGDIWYWISWIWQKVCWIGMGHCVCRHVHNPTLNMCNFPCVNIAVAFHLQLSLWLWVQPMPNHFTWAQNPVKQFGQILWYAARLHARTNTYNQIILLVRLYPEWLIRRSLTVHQTVFGADTAPSALATNLETRLQWDFRSVIRDTVEYSAYPFSTAVYATFMIIHRDSYFHCHSYIRAVSHRASSQQDYQRVIQRVCFGNHEQGEKFEKVL